MPLVETDAIVLHVFDYSETSRILRLATRDAGLQSVLARGARRSKSRFGSALDLFAEGAAQLQLKDGRDLQTLASFDVTRSRAELGEDMGRFVGASALAELVLRFSGADDVSVALFEVLADALDRLAASQDDARDGGDALWCMASRGGDGFRTRHRLVRVVPRGHRGGRRPAVQPHGRRRAL